MGVDSGHSTQKGAGNLPLYRTQNGCTEQWVLWAPEAPEILFQAHTTGKFFCSIFLLFVFVCCLLLCVYTKNSQSFVEKTKMDEKHKKGF